VTVCEFPEVSDEAIIVAAHGFGRTMIAKSLVHQAILAGHSRTLPERGGLNPRPDPARDRSRAAAPPPILLRPNLMALR
jgi:hypothetical protein